MHRGYILGGILWFAVPYTLSTCLGLGALALDLPLSAAEVGKGLVPPAIAYHLFGQGALPPPALTTNQLSVTLLFAPHHVWWNRCQMHPTVALAVCEHLKP